MQYRLNSGAMIAVSLLVLTALGVFGYTFLSGKGEGQQAAVEDALPNVDTPQMVITAKHQFENGLHTIAGETSVPTSCHTLTAETFFKDGDPLNSEVRFKTATTDATGCAPVATPARFKVSFEAPENAALSATWDDAPAVLNLIEATSEESLDDYEIYIKG